MLADFGVAATMERGGSWGNQQMARNTFVGTPCWMAPEVMEHTQGCAPATHPQPHTPGMLDGMLVMSSWRSELSGLDACNAHIIWSQVKGWSGCFDRHKQIAGLSYCLLIGRSFDLTSSSECLVDRAAFRVRLGLGL